MRVQHLDGHLIANAQVLGQIDGTHPARAEFPKDFIIANGGADHCLLNFFSKS
jgi:hypothetical protein